MNIVEAYVKFNNGMIIIISGLSGSGKTKVASYIEKDLKIKKIDLDDYCKEENHITVKLPNDITVEDWDHIDVYDWKKFNEDVEKYKNRGVVLCGAYFPSDKITSNVDFHIHIKISKQQIIEKRTEYIKKYPDKCPTLKEHLDSNIVKLLINTVTYPHYIEYRNKSKIDLWISADELTTEKIYDNVFDFLMGKIQQFLNARVNSSQKTQNKSDIKKTRKNDNDNDDMNGEYLGTTYNEEDEQNYLV